MPIEGVVSIDQNTQLLSARNLATDLTDLATASVLTQAHALVLTDAAGNRDLRRPGAGLFRDHGVFAGG